jgi:hypothetical protein
MSEREFWLTLGGGAIGVNLAGLLVFGGFLPAIGMILAIVGTLLVVKYE